MSGLMLGVFLLDLGLNSGHLSYLVIDYYQLLFMVLFLGIDYPPALNHFLYGFRYSHYLFLPQVFRGDPQQQYSSATPDKFGVIVPDVHFLNNAGPALLVVGAALAALLLAKGSEWLLLKARRCRSNRVGDEGSEPQEEESRCMQLLKAVVSRFKWNYFNDVIYTLYFSLLLFAFSQLYDLTWRSRSASSILSILLAFAFIIGGLLLPAALAYLLHSNKDCLLEQSLGQEREQAERKKRGGSEGRSSRSEEEEERG
jgi:hypothetical protein